MDNSIHSLHSSFCIVYSVYDSMFEASQHEQVELYNKVKFIGLLVPQSSMADDTTTYAPFVLQVEREHEC